MEVAIGTRGAPGNASHNLGLESVWETLLEFNQRKNMSQSRRPESMAHLVADVVEAKGICKDLVVGEWKDVQKPDRHVPSKAY